MAWQVSVRCIFYSFSARPVIFVDMAASPPSLKFFIVLYIWRLGWESSLSRLEVVGDTG